MFVCNRDITVSLGAPDKEASTDEFELKFPELSHAKLKRSRAKLGHSNFRAETELKLS